MKNLKNLLYGSSTFLAAIACSLNCNTLHGQDSFIASDGLNNLQYTSIERDLNNKEYGREGNKIESRLCMFDEEIASLFEKIKKIKARTSWKELEQSKDNRINCQADINRCQSGLCQIRENGQANLQQARTMGPEAIGLTVPNETKINEVKDKLKEAESLYNQAVIEYYNKVRKTMPQLIELTTVAFEDTEKEYILDVLNNDAKANASLTESSMLDSAFLDSSELNQAWDNFINRYYERNSVPDATQGAWLGQNHTQHEAAQNKEGEAWNNLKIARNTAITKFQDIFDNTSSNSVDSSSSFSSSSSSY